MSKPQRPTERFEIRYQDRDISWERKGTELYLNGYKLISVFTDQQWGTLRTEFCTNGSHYTTPFADHEFTELGRGDQGRVITWDEPDKVAKVSTIMPFIWLNSNQWRSITEAKAIIQKEFQIINSLTGPAPTPLLLPKIYAFYDAPRHAIMVMEKLTPVAPGELTYRECVAVHEHFWALLKKGYRDCDGQIEVMRREDGSIVVTDYGFLQEIQGMTRQQIKYVQEDMTWAIASLFNKHGHRYWVQELSKAKSALLLNRVQRGMR